MWSNVILTIVYSRVKNMLRTKYPSAYFTTNVRESTKPPKFPSIVFRQLQGAELSPDISGQTVNIVQSNIQVDIIANDEQSTAYDLADAVMNAMKSMGYQVVGTPFIDESDTNSYRVITRYRANVGGENKL